MHSINVGNETARLDFRKTDFSAAQKHLAYNVLRVRAMSSFDSIYKKMASSLEQGGAGHSHEPAQTFDFSRHIAPVVAHELNNIFTIIQGYADRLLLQYREDPALQPHLKLISEATKRAALIVRDATPPNAGAALRQNPPPPATPAA